MAFTYRWGDLLELVKKQVKNIPTQPIDALQCDWVSGLIAEKLPWKMLQQTIARGQIPLIDGYQDYDPPFNISKLSEASLRCTSQTPEEDISLNILDSLAREPRRRSVYAITSIALQAGVGKLRLVSAVAIPVNQTWEIRGQYEINPTKITSLDQGIWFDDKYVHLAIEGLKYCYFQMADDPRAGTVTATGLGESQYTGQIATFVSALKRMADAETRNLDQIAMPDAPLGIASRQYGALIAGYGFGFGGGPGSGAVQQGLVALNNDTTPMQYLVAGPGISISSVGIGYTMISLTGTAPPLAPPTVIAISPPSGPQTGGTAVTITGTNFAPGAIVLFGTTAAATNVIAVSDTTITCVSPPGNVGVVTVWVTLQGQSASLQNSFTYTYVAPPPTPTVADVSPNVGPANTTTAVTITGTNFAAGATVTFGGLAATNVVVVNTMTITCTAPARTAGAVTVAVTVGGQTGSLTNGFTYQAVAAPIYGGLGAKSDATGVTMSGSNLVLVPYTGDILSVLQNTAEQVGQSWPFTPATQCICLVLYGGTHTFVDQSNNNVPMVPPIPVTVNGNPMFLYSTQFQLFFPTTVKIAS